MEIEEPVEFAEFLNEFDQMQAAGMMFTERNGSGFPPDLRYKKITALIGPEGGFSDEERELLLSHEFVVPISLGPRILRADTAAVAALALVQAIIGDWR